MHGESTGLGADVFEEAWQRCSWTIEYDRAWSSGGGLLDGAVHGPSAPAMPSGSVCRASSPGGLRVLIVGTLLGNLAVFERGTKEIPQLRYCTTVGIAETGWFSGLFLDDYEMELALGGRSAYNIGERIETLAGLLKKRNADSSKRPPSAINA